MWKQGALIKERKGESYGTLRQRYLISRMCSYSCVGTRTIYLVLTGLLSASTLWLDCQEPSGFFLPGICPHTLMWDISCNIDTFLTVFRIYKNNVAHRFALITVGNVNGARGAPRWRRVQSLATRRNFIPCKWISFLKISYRNSWIWVFKWFFLFSCHYSSSVLLIK